MLLGRACRTRERQNSNRELKQRRREREREREQQKSNRFRACLHGGRGPLIGELTCGGSLHLSCKRDQIKMRHGQVGYLTYLGSPPFM